MYAKSLNNKITVTIFSDFQSKVRDKSKPEARSKVEREVSFVSLRLVLLINQPSKQGTFSDIKNVDSLFMRLGLDGGDSATWEPQSLPLICQVTCTVSQTKAHFTKLPVKCVDWARGSLIALLTQTCFSFVSLLSS